MKNPIFSRNWHPRNPCATNWQFWKPAALQAWCLAFTKNFEWFANGTVLGQNSLNSFEGKTCKKNRKIQKGNHISCLNILSQSQINGL